MATSLSRYRKVQSQLERGDHGSLAIGYLASALRDSWLDRQPKGPERYRPILSLAHFQSARWPACRDRAPIAKLGRRRNARLEGFDCLSFVWTVAPSRLGIMGAGVPSLRRQETRPFGGHQKMSSVRRNDQGRGNQVPLLRRGRSDFTELIAWPRVELEKD